MSLKVGDVVRLKKTKLILHKGLQKGDVGVVTQVGEWNPYLNEMRTTDIYVQFFNGVKDTVYIKHLELIKEGDNNVK